MIQTPTARQLLTEAPETPPADAVMLRQSDRAIRLRQLQTMGGESFIVDLPFRTQLDGNYGFLLEDGRVIQILYEPEHLLEIRGDLTRYVWHIGCLKQHCQIEKDRLLIQYHPDMERLLLALGARLCRVTEPFSPEMPVHLTHVHGRDCGPECEPENQTDPEIGPAGPSAPVTDLGPF